MLTVQSPTSSFGAQLGEIGMHAAGVFANSPDAETVDFEVHYPDQNRTDMVTVNRLGAVVASITLVGDDA